MPALDRTAKYFEALNREGDEFDHGKWLQRVRDEEGQAKRFSAAFTSSETVQIETDNVNTTPTTRAALIKLEPPVRTSEIMARKVGQRADIEPKGESPENRLRRRLSKVCDAWDDFQASRARNAPYPYLTAVYSIVMHYKVRRKTKKLLWHAFRFAGLPFDQDADPFAVVVRCTCEHSLDNKTISKFSRALRYAAYSGLAPVERTHPVRAALLK